MTVESARFDWAAFQTWVLADYGMAAATLKYYSSRIRAMQRLGLDLEACVADPRTLKRQGADVIANSKLPRVVKGKLRRPSCHVTRNYQRALNWISDYGRHLELEDLRYQLGRGADDQDVEERVRRWHRWDLDPEPASMPKSIDVPDLGIFRTYVHARCTNQCRRTQPAGRAHCYTTYLCRGAYEVALAGNFRRGEMEQVTTTGLLPQLGKIRLPHAMKGSVSGDVDVPWSLFWPESGLMQFLQVRVDVPGSDALFTVPPGHGSKVPRALGGAAIYTYLYKMGKELGVPLNLVRTKRRALSDIDEARVDVRVTQAKGRHVKIENTITYLGQVTSSRQRRELAERGVPGYSAEDALRVVDLVGRPVFATAILPPVPGDHRDGVAAAVPAQDPDLRGAPRPPGVGARAAGGGPLAGGGRGGLPGREGRGQPAWQDLRQRDGRAQRPGPAAPSAAGRLAPGGAARGRVGLDVVGPELVDGVVGRVGQALEGAGAVLQAGADSPKRHDEKGQEQEGRAEENRQERDRVAVDGHGRPADGGHKGLPTGFRDPRPPGLASCPACGALLLTRPGSENPAALYGAHGLPQPSRTDERQLVVPGQPAASTACDPLSRNLGDTTSMYTTPVLTKKGSLGRAEPITTNPAAWRPTEAASTTSAGLPAREIQALDPADTTKAEERAFTRKPGVAPTGATGTSSRFTRLPLTRRATHAEMQARLKRPVSSPSSIARTDRVDVLA